MIFQEREYQRDAVTSIFDYFAENSGNPLVALPTGTGKAVIISLFLQEAYKLWPRQKILVLTHVKELISQNYEKLLWLWPNAPAGVYSAGLKQRDTLSRIVFGGIASVAKNPQQFGHVDLIIIDEAHLVSPAASAQYNQFIATAKEINPLLKVIGLTATPFRLGQGMLTDGGLFTDICFDMTSFSAFNKLVTDGYICSLITRRPKVVLDVSGLHLQAGEYKQKEVELAFSLQEITRVAVDDIIDKGSARKHILVFATSIEHAEEIVELFSFRGIDAGIVHSKMPDKQRDASLADFKSGEYRVMVNMGVLTTGFDFPELDLIAVLRATTSPALWVQIIGRGTRVAQGKENCLVLDYGGNIERLGPINDPVIPRKKGEGTGAAPVKLCMSCDTYNHISARECTFCGDAFSFAVKIDLHAATADIVKADNHVVEEFIVDHCTYARHRKSGRPDSVKVTYHCGTRYFYEFVCLEHQQEARRMSEKWWKKRTDLPVPATTNDALTTLHDYGVKVASRLKVLVSAKYPEILSYIFDKQGGD